MTWVERVRDVDVVDVASRLGLAVSPRGHFGPCPSCAAERRHPKRRDRRFACGVRPDRIVWFCLECDARGDALDLVALHERGRRMRDLDRDRRAHVRKWFEDFMPELTPIERTAEPEGYPDPAEVALLWDDSAAVDRDAEVAGYLRSRRIDPARVADRDLARALRRDARAPWARFQGAPWAMCGLRLIVPLFDSSGSLRSVLARRVAGDGAKSIAPTGKSRRKLVMADALARRLLELGAIAPDWPRVRVAVCEGEIDFLVAASQVSDADEHARAIFGITSGSWCAEVAARVPDGAELVIATDHDEQGEVYARAIIESFNGRAVSLARWRPA